MQHTPGPWKVVKPRHGCPSEYLCVQLGKDECYATLEMLPSDARLVAAVPDLLEAVALGVRVREAQRHYFKVRTQEALVASKALEREFDKKAAKVIAKATGE